MSRCTFQWFFPLLLLFELNIHGTVGGANSIAGNVLQRPLRSNTGQHPSGGQFLVNIKGSSTYEEFSSLLKTLTLSSANDINHLLFHHPDGRLLDYNQWIKNTFAPVHPKILFATRDAYETRRKLGPPQIRGDDIDAKFCAQLSSWLNRYINNHIELTTAVKRLGDEVKECTFWSPCSILEKPTRLLIEALTALLDNLLMPLIGSCQEILDWTEYVTFYCTAAEAALDAMKFTIMNMPWVDHKFFHFLEVFYDILIAFVDCLREAVALYNEYALQN